jgi:hypothetical protein
MESIDLGPILDRAESASNALVKWESLVFAANGYKPNEITMEAATINGELAEAIRELTILKSSLESEIEGLNDPTLDPFFKDRITERHKETLRRAKNWARRTEKILVRAQVVLHALDTWTPAKPSTAFDTPTPPSKPAPNAAPKPTPKPSPTGTPKKATSIVEGVYNGNISRKNLSLRYYNETRSELMGAVRKGMGDRKGYEILFDDLQLNVQAFSAAKTYNLVRDLEALQKGNPNYKDYEPKAQALVKQYDVWGEAEINTAQQQTHQAKQWHIIKEDADLFKILKYSTIGDACKICKPLDGITAPVNSPIWRRIYPCNHYNCYCIVIQITEDDGPFTDAKTLANLVAGSTELMNPVFMSNPGITNKVYTNKHPYFSSVPKSDRDFARENFGLPIK